jgi:hemerythrin-like domain-containing protein
MSAIEILVDEHELISRMVKGLTVFHESLRSGGEADLDVLKDVVDFFQIFVDKNHHAKEENAFFPILERHEVNPEGCSIESLRNEHKQARVLITALDHAIGEYKTGDPGAKSSISRPVRESIDLYNNHIWRENILLFPIGEKTLQESELSEITRSYEQVEKNLSIGFRAKYEQLVNGLEKATARGHGAK